MATEEIVLNGKRILTLRELLRPGLSAIFVGVNPANTSVQMGHYYQGRIGRRFWKRLQKHHIVPVLTTGQEDDEAFLRGFGFADLVRRPTKSARELLTEEKLAAVSDLRARLSTTGDRPAIVFVFTEARKFAKAELEQAGYRVLEMPAPFAGRKDVDCAMGQLKRALNPRVISGPRSTFTIPSASDNFEYLLRVYFGSESDRLSSCVRPGLPRLQQDASRNLAPRERRRGSSSCFQGGAIIPHGTGAQQARYL
jgi:G:T/U-mismatch repair DNA glycosylase